MSAVTTTVRSWWRKQSIITKISCGIIGTAFAAYLAGVDISPGNYYRRKKQAEQAEQKADQHRQEAVTTPRKATKWDI